MVFINLMLIIKLINFKLYALHKALHEALYEALQLGSHLIFYPSFFTYSLPRGTPERQPADDRRQSQTTVAGARWPSLEPDNRRQSRTTVVRARWPSSELDDRRQSHTTAARARQPFKRPASEHYKRFDRSIKLR
jgi:hypothetical protein